MKYKKSKLKHTEGCQLKTNAPQNGAFLPLLTNLAGGMRDYSFTQCSLFLYRKVRSGSAYIVC